jgi:hypothetical protein
MPAIGRITQFVETECGGHLAQTMIEPAGRGPGKPFPSTVSHIGSSHHEEEKACVRFPATVPEKLMLRLSEMSSDWLAR